MKPVARFTRASIVSTLFCVVIAARAFAQADPLPSWNDGPAKKALIAMVQETTAPSGPKFVRPEERVATFDQDGTLWVEHPIYTQVVFSLDRVPAIVAKKPELREV